MEWDDSKWVCFSCFMPWRGVSKWRSDNKEGLHYAKSPTMCRLEKQVGFVLSS